MGKMNISSEMLNKRIFFPSAPYFRRDTRQFLHAIRHGDINKVRLLVKFSNRFLVFDYDDCHQTGLIWACKMNFTNIAKFLVDNHSRVNW
jgi:hypothetical protein